MNTFDDFMDEDALYEARLASAEVARDDEDPPDADEPCPHGNGKHYFQNRGYGGMLDGVAHDRIVCGLCGAEYAQIHRDTVMP